MKKEQDEHNDHDDMQMGDALMDWIRRSNGGHVHQSLMVTTCQQDGLRGVVCRTHISRGELLIRLPSSLVLSGQTMPSMYQRPNDDDDDDCKHASPWLKCLAALYQAHNVQPKDDSNHYRSYLDSLPDDYEHLFQWTDQQIEHDLQGTTLGRIVQQDRSEGTLEERYVTSVRPYLEACNVLPRRPQDNDDDDEGGSSAEELAFFRKACMCLSTRGFHMQSSFETDSNHNSGDEETECYSGPFLLPLIDMMNHNPAMSCTTLKREKNHDDDDRDATTMTSPRGSCFYMIAERNIAKGEQLYHSYGDTLTSAQVLQTFGFVPNDSICRAARTVAATAATWKLSSRRPSSHRKEDEEEDNSGVGRELTPAFVSVASIVQACSEMLQSGYPRALQEYIERHDLDEETWNITELRDWNDFGFLLPNEYIAIISVTDENGGDDKESNHVSSALLSSELVTACTLPLLPSDVYQEFMSDSPSLLDSSVLQDYYLGKLVCRTLLLVADKRMQEYGIDSRVDASNKLRQMYENLASTTRSSTSNSTDEAKRIADLRFIYGLTIRLEEVSCLHQFRSKLLALLDSMEVDKECDNCDHEVGNDNQNVKERAITNGKRKRIQ